MTEATPLPGRGLYLITPDEADTARLLDRVAPLLALGVAALQLRNKLADAALRRRQALALLPLCRAAGTPLLINDDWQAAADTGADGVHLGGRDGDLAQVRAILGPRAIIGASCYNNLERASQAAAQGASYLAFGAFFPSTSKPGVARAAPGLLAQAAKLGLPLVAIGGITPDNAAQVIAAGADYVAAIAAVFHSPDPAASVLAFRACFR
jgi:thiamine-phosphate pyrophosphorylase